MPSRKPVRHTLHVDRFDSDEATIYVPKFRRGRGVLAMCHGSWEPPSPPERVLVRIQSSCLYGEVLGSRDCDCRDQLEKAKDTIADEGAGIIVYLEQEGRGAGLRAKARGYEFVQRNKAVDTFAAYRALGLRPDQRRYDAAVRLLRELGVTSVRLLTNNPEKLTALEKAGFEVRREPLVIPPTERTRKYLESKRRHGHLIERVVPPGPSSAGQLLPLGRDVGGGVRGQDGRRPTEERLGAPHACDDALRDRDGHELEPRDEVTGGVDAVDAGHAAVVDLDTTVVVDRAPEFPGELRAGLVGDGEEGERAGHLPPRFEPGGAQAPSPAHERDDVLLDDLDTVAVEH
jgi:GTP cyclohydrolase II